MRQGMFPSRWVSRKYACDGADSRIRMLVLSGISIYNNRSYHVLSHILSHYANSRPVVRYPISQMYTKTIPISRPAFVSAVMTSQEWSRLGIGHLSQQSLFVAQPAAFPTTVLPYLPSEVVAESPLHRYLIHRILTRGRRVDCSSFGAWLLVTQRRWWLPRAQMVDHPVRRRPRNLIDSPLADPQQYFAKLSASRSPRRRDYIYIMIKVHTMGKSGAILCCLTLHSIGTIFSLSNKCFGRFMIHACQRRDLAQ